MAFNMLDYSSGDAGRAARRGSPALSDISELTILSRSPSPIPDYDARFSGSTAGTTSTKQPLRGQDGRFVSRRAKRAHSPEQRSTKKAKPTSLPTPPQTPRKCRFDPELVSPTPEQGSSAFLAVCQGGFGTLGVLPREIRQIIFAYALDANRAIYVKKCCGPDATTRERDSCKRHGRGATIKIGRFDFMQTSKAINDEAAWVLYSHILLIIDVTQSLKPYLSSSGSSRSIRHLSRASNDSTRKTTMWTAAARFRSIAIFVPEFYLVSRDPSVFTGYLLEIACLLGKCWQDRYTNPDPDSSVAHHVNLDLGSLFRQMLPFNMDSQAEDKYTDLLEWKHLNYPNEEPDFDTITADSGKHLKRLVSVMGMQYRYAEWTVAAETQLDDKDEGGMKALETLINDCITNGVVFDHLD